ncbi:MAG: GNAT family N-acetyltransferase [Actinomycetota bacterium]|nr:GNAT family N-acetyltransferase [Actinomycetota bacterium]
MKNAHELFERCQRFEKNLFVSISPIVESWSLGRAFFNPQLPDVWDRNIAFAERDTADADPTELLRELDDLFAALGSRHRKVAVPEHFLSDAIVETFGGTGWGPETLVTMVFARDDLPPAPTLDVREVSADDYRAMTSAFVQEDPDVTARPEIAEQIVESSARIAVEASARYFALSRENGIVAGCHLYSDGSTAQIEDVATLKAHRGRGYSDAVMRRALRNAFEAGHDLVFLVADEEDWPKDFYGRLGFETVGRTIDLLRKPKDT